MDDAKKIEALDRIERSAWAAITEPNGENVHYTNRAEALTVIYHCRAIRAALLRVEPRPLPPVKCQRPDCTITGRIMIPRCQRADCPWNEAAERE